ncbi:MAG: PAS domain S-box protein [Anaerolineae bacterium]
MTNRDNDELRRQAEEIVRARAAQTPDIEPLSPEAMRQTLHELKVHQIELEMQNEELRRTQLELQLSHERYVDLYDMAPVGYLTLSDKGIILEANLTAATLLGVPRGDLATQPFSQFILKEDQDQLYLLRKRLNSNPAPQVVELRMVTGNGGSFWGHLLMTIVVNEDTSTSYRIALSDITERKHSEEALRTSDERLKAIASNTPDHVIIQDRQLRYTLVINPQLGLTEGDMLGKTDYDILLKREADQVTRIKTRVLESGHAEHLAMPFLSLSGTMEEFDGTYIPMVDDQGNVNGLIGYFRNVTERKRIEAALHEADERFQQLFDHMAEGMAVYQAVDDGQDFIIVDINQTGQIFSMVDRQEVLGRRVTEVFPGVIQMGLLDVLRRVWHSGQPEQHPLTQYTDDRIEHWVKNYVYRLPSGLVAAVYADTSEEHRAEEALRQSEGKYRELVEYLSEGVSSVDPDEVFTLANPAAERIFGVGSGELVGKCLDVFLLPASQALIRAGTARRALGYSDSYNLEIIRPDGERRFLHITSTPRYDAEGQFCGASAIFHDNTERKLAEEARRESEETQRALLANLPAGIIVVDPVTRVIEQVNEHASLLFGASAAQMIGKRCHAFLCPAQERACPVCDLGLTIDNSERVLVRADGSHLAIFKSVRWVLLNGHEKLLECFVDISERKRAEEALAAERNMMRTLIDALPSSVYIKDLAGHILLANRAMAELVGKPDPHALVGLTDYDLFAKEHAQGYWEIEQHVLNTGEPILNIEGALTDAAGRSLWYLNSKVPLCDEWGTVVGLVGVSSDITERKQVEVTLRQANEQLTRTQRAAGAGLWDWDIATTTQHWSPELFHLFGLDPETCSATLDVWRNAMHPDDRLAAEERQNRAIRDHKALDNEYRIITPSGQVRWINALGDTQYTETGEPIRISGICLDITKRRRAEQELRESERLYHLLADHMTDTVWLMDMNMNTTYSSPSTLKLRGFTAEESQSQSLDQKLTPASLKIAKDFIAEEMPRLLADPSYSFVRSLELEFYKKDGTTFWTENTLSFIRDENGKPQSILGEGRDISERKQAEEHIRSLAKFPAENPDAVLRVAQDSILMYANPQALVQLPEWNLRVGDRVPQFMENVVRECMGSASRLRLDLEHGKQVFSFVVVPVPESGYINLYGQDVTHRRQSEKALAESEERFQLANRATYNAIWDWNLVTGSVWRNENYGILFGYQDEDMELNIEMWFDHLHPEDRERVVVGIRAAIDSAQTYWGDQYRFRRKDGEYSTIEDRGFISRDSNGRPVRMIGAMQDITERKQAEEALRESESRFRSIFDESPVAIWEEDFTAIKQRFDELRQSGITDFRAYLNAHPEEVASLVARIRVVAVNRQALELLGAESTASLAANLPGYFTPDSLPAFSEEMIALAEGGNTFHAEVPIIDSDGKQLFVELDLTVPSEHEHDLSRVLVSFLDITERKQAEEQISSLARFPLENPDAVLRISLDYTVMYANPQALLQLPEWNLKVGERVPPFLEEVVRECMASTSRLALDLVHGRQVFSFLVVPVLESGYANLYGHDVTHRRQSEKALAESEERFQLANRATFNVIWDWNVQTGVFWRNENYQTLFGYAAEEIEPNIESWLDWIHYEDVERVKKGLREALASEQDHWSDQYRLPRKGGMYADIEDRAYITRDANGKAVRMIGAMQDITGRKQAEAYADMGRQVLQILNESLDMQDTLQQVIGKIKTQTGFDAVGIRLKEGEDYPYIANKGFWNDFIQTENTLLERDADGSIVRNEDGSARLVCSCGLVLSGRHDPANPLLTPGGSLWTNDTAPILNIPSDQDPRFHPRDNCIQQGFSSIALVPIRNKDEIVGLIHLCDRRKGCFTLATIELLEGIASHIGAALLRKQAEEALRNSEKDLKESQRIAHVGSWHLDVATNQVVWTDELYKMYGFDPSLPPPPYTEHMKLFTPESWQRLSTALVHTMETGIPYTLELQTIRKDGSNGWMWVHGEADVDATGKMGSLWGAAQDITERKQAEEALRLKNLVFDESLAAISIADLSGVITETNASFVRTWGYASKDEVVGRSLASFFQNQEEAVAIITTLNSMGAWEGDFTAKRKDGSNYSAHSMATVIHNDRGEVVGYQSSVEDVTNEREAMARNVHLTKVLKAIRNVNQLIFREKDPARLIQQACKLLIETRGYNAVWIVLGTPGSPPLALAQAGWGETFEPFARSLDEGRWPRCCDISASTSEGFASLDPKEDCRACILGGEYGHHLAAISCLRRQERDFGMLGVSFPHGVPFDEEEKGLLLEVAGDISFALYDIDLEERRSQAETALRVNNARLELAMQAASMSWWDMNMADGSVTFGIQKAAMLGYPPEQFTHYQDFMALVHPDDTEQVMDAMRGHLEGRLDAYRAEYRIQTREHGYVWFYDIGHVTKSDTSGNPSHVTGLVIDITERKRAEERILRDELRLKSIINILQFHSESVQGFLDNALNEAINLTESQLGYIYFYHEDRQQFMLNTWSKQVMHECTIRDAQATYDLEKTGIWGEAVRQRKAIILNDYLADNPLKKGYPAGHARLDRFMTVPIFKDNQIVAVVGVANKASDYDDTDVLQLTLLMEAVWKSVDATRAQESLRENEEKFRLSFMTSMDGFYIATRERGEFLEINRVFEDIFGYTREEVIGHTSRQLGLYADPDERTRVLLELNDKGYIKDHEYRGRKKNGEIIIFSLSINTLMINNEAHNIGVIRDITERKKAEEALRESEEREYRTKLSEQQQRLEIERKAAQELRQKAEELERSNRDLQQFAYVASHDLQEPLRMVASYTQLLAERYQGQLDAKADKYIAYAVEGAIRMQQLLKDLLAFSRLTTRANPFTETDCTQLVKEVIGNLSETIKQSGAKVIVRDLPTVVADAAQLSQVFRNLIDNAIKFKNTTPPQVEITARRNGDDWEFCVADNGIGIDPQFYERVFIIFQRLHARDKYPGNGIGLSICKKILERHGGRMWIESQVGEGTRIWFTLPALPYDTEGNM